MVNTLTLEDTVVAPTFSLMKPTDVNSAAFKDAQSEKHNIALGDLSPGVPTLRSAMETGDVGRYEELMAQKKQLELANARNEIVQQIATANERPITNVDLEVVRGLSEQDITAPELNGILEKEYARKVTELTALLHNEENESYDDALDADGITTEDIMSHYEGQAARNLIVQKMLDEVKTRFDGPDDYLLKQGIAWGQQLVPFLGWAQTNTFLPDSPDNALLPGDSIEKQISYFNTLQPEEAQRVLRQAVESQIAMGNYLGAMSFLSNMLSYSPQNKFIENALAGVDVATSGAIGAFSRGIKGVGKAVLRAPKDTVGMSLDVGLEAEAAKIKLGETISTNVLPGVGVKNITDIENIVPTLSRPQEAFVGGKLRAGAPTLNRLTVASMERAKAAVDLFTQVNKIDRLSPQALEVGLNAAEESLRKNFTHANHNVVNVSRKLADNVTNVNSVTVSFGKTDGTAFTTKLSAQKAAKNWFALKTDDYDIVQTDAGWVIDITRNVDESTDAVKNIDIETNGPSPDTVAQKMFGYLQGANQKLTKSQQTVRAQAVQSSEQAGALMEAFAEPIKALGKGERKEFEDFYRSLNDFVAPDGKKGKRFKNVYDFEDTWYAKHNKLPTYAQYDAWNAMQQFDDFDWLSRTFDVYKQKSIMGIEEFSFKLGDTSLSFEGKQLDSLPRGKDFSVAIINNGSDIKQSKFMKDTDWQKIDNLISTDYKVIQPYRDLVKVGNKYANFVLVRDFKRNRPNLKDQIVRADTNRTVQKHPWYIKQPRVSNSDGRAFYRGDLSVVNARSQKEAQFILDSLNKAVDMIKRGDRGVVKYFSENLPMFSYKQFAKMVKNGEIDPNSPFVVTRAGNSTIDTVDVGSKINANEFVSNREYDLSQRVMGRFAGDPTPVNMDVYGVENNTIMRFDGDSTLSPFDTMRMSMSNLIDTNVMHDYKIKSVRDFTTEFGDLLEGSKLDFDNNGLKYIFEPKYRKGITPDQRNRAEGVRTSILSLINNKTFVERQIDMHKENIVNSIAPGWAKDVTDWTLVKASTADRWLRGAAFHTKMGMFNPKQLWLQASTAAQVVMIAGLNHGSKGARAAPLLMRVPYADEGILKGIAAKATISGFSQEEFLELSQVYRRSGFNHVGGDVAYLDDMKPPDLKKGAIGKVLDWGRTPFNVGERAARATAFAAAYSERKAMLKGKALSRQDEAWILKRSTDLTGNMTRDSNAAWQKGYGAVFTQFMGFQARMMELMLGKSLNKWEKARLFTGMSMLYGVPVAAGMTVGVVPVREYVRGMLAENGIEYDNTLVEPFVDGFASWLLEQATGADVDIAGSYGPGGLTTFTDFIKGDTQFVDVVLGASGGIAWDTIQDLDPVIQFAVATLDFNDNTYFPISVQDLIEPLRNISTINSGIKYMEAINTGKWISQNENILTEDITELEAVISATFGVDPSRVSDSFIDKDITTKWTNHKNEETKKIIIDYRRAMAAMRDGNQKDADLLFGRVKGRMIQLGLTTREMNQIYSRAVSEEPFDEAILKQFQKMKERQ